MDEDGIYFGGRRPLGKSSVTHREKKIASVAPGTSVENDSMLSFVITTGPYEFAKFSHDSFMVELFGRYTNPQYDAAGATNEIKAEKHALRAKTKKPYAYLEPSIAGAALFEKYEVLINQKEVPQNIGNYSPYYTRLSKLFSSGSGERDDALTITNISDVKTQAGPGAAVLYNNPPVYMAATGYLDYHTYNSKRGKTVPVYLEGLFPFSQNCRTISSIDGREEPHGLIPCNTTIEFRAYKKSPLNQMVGADIAFSGYYQEEQATTDPVEIELTIKNAVLAYESVHVKPNKIREMQGKLADKGELIFHYDKPHVQVYSLPQNIRNINQTFVIPASCRILYLAFFKSWQLFYTPAKKKRTSTHLFYPDNLARLSLDFAHNQDILIKDGLHDLGNVGHNNHPSQRLFYNYLREKNIFNYDFETLFPTGAERVSGCQAVAVDLKPYMIDSPQQLTVKCVFDENLSPSDTYLILFSVHTNGKITYSKREDWKFE